MCKGIPAEIGMIRKMKKDINQNRKTPSYCIFHYTILAEI